MVSDIEVHNISKVFEYDLVFFILCRVLWERAIRHYVSASS